MLERKFNFGERGISLVGVIISVAIIAILAASLVHYLLPYRQEVALDEQAGEISNYLELARAKSIGMTDNKDWGVHLENLSDGDDYFEFYSTVSDYTQKEVKTTIYFSWGVELSSPVAGDSLTIQFTKGSGETADNSAVITAENGDSRTISVNSAGMVSVSKN